MKEQLDRLKHYLKRKRKLSLDNLKTALVISNDDVLMTQILDLIERELKSFNFNTVPQRYSFLFSCLDYLEYNTNRVNFSDDFSYQYISSRLGQIFELIDLKLNEKVSVAKYNNYLSNIELLSKLKERITSYRNQYEDLEEKVKKENIYYIIHHIIFEVKDITYVGKLFEDFPNYKSYNNLDGKPLIHEIFDHFFNAVIKNIDEHEIEYYKKVIHLYAKRNCNIEVLSVIKSYLIAFKNKIYSEEIDASTKGRIEYRLAQIAKEFKFDKPSKELINEDKLVMEFPAAVLEASKKVNYSSLKGYIDYTNRRIITIDYAECNFREDAFSLEVMKDESYQLGIYITDLDALVKEFDILDCEAQKRAIDAKKKYGSLFPYDFLKRFASLTAGVNRPVIAYTFTYDKCGNRTGVKVEKAIINVSVNYNHTSIKKELSKNKDDMVSLCYNLIDLRSKQFKGKHNAKTLSHNLESLNIQKNLVAQQVITALAVYLNSFVSSYFDRHELPFIYRIDKSSQEEEVKSLINEKLGSCHDARKILDSLRKTDNRTKLSPINNGNNNSASKAYGCVTNPGRMYDALVNLRLIKKYLIDNLYRDHDQIVKDAYYIQFLCKYMNDKNETIFYKKEEMAKDEARKVITKKHGSKGYVRH